MFYVEAPNLATNPAAFEAIWDEAYDNVGYFGINSPVDACFDCGFEGEFRCDSQGYILPQLRQPRRNPRQRYPPPATWAPHETAGGGGQTGGDCQPC